MSFKCWPASRFAEIARRLYGLTGWSGVVCGGPGEAELGAALAGEQPPVTDLVGKTSLAGLVEVIRRARLVVTNDTVAVHFAGAVEIPSVCVLGGGHYGRFLPYPGGGPLAVTHRMDCFGCDWECVHRTPPGRPYPCVDRVTVDDVWEAVLELVGTGAAAGTAEAGSGRSLALAQTLPASKENFR